MARADAVSSSVAIRFSILSGRQVSIRGSTAVSPAFSHVQPFLGAVLEGHSSLGVHDALPVPPIRRPLVDLAFILLSPRNCL